MKLGVDLALATVAGLLLILLSTIETAYAQISDVSLHILRGGPKSERREAFFDELMTHQDRFHTALLLGINTLVIAIAVVTVQAVQHLQIPRSILASFLVALAVVCGLRLLVPRLIAQSDPERVLIGLLPLFKPYYRAVSLVVVPYLGLVTLLKRAEPEAQSDDDESIDETMTDIQALIDVGEEEGIIEESEGLMIQSIVELGETSVHEVMTPRTQIVAISATSTVLDARDVMVASKHSRLPIYSEHIDNVEGVLYVRDLLGAWSEGRENGPVTDLMRPAYFVPEVKPVADLLEEMRKSQVQIALVIDEYGAVAGLITIEDLLEEIVGEIEDEDVVVTDSEDVVVGEDGSMLVKGSTEIRKIELQLETELDADDFTTVAGLIINELGHLPARGEQLEFKGLLFEVVEADSRRVHMVRLRPIAPPETEEQKEVTQQG
jgi:putative hemolysin